MPYNKAIVAAVTAFLAPIITLVASPVELDWRGVLGGILAGVVSGLATYSVPNKPAAPSSDPLV